MNTIKTKDSSEPKKKVNPRAKGRNFCATVHGAKSEDLALLKARFDAPSILRAVIARESGKHSIHPHFQIYVQTGIDQSGRKLFRDALKHTNVHVETARGTLEANLKYVYAVSPGKQYEIGWVLYEKNVQRPWEFEYKAQQAQKYIQPKLKPWQAYLDGIITGQPADDRTIHYFWEPKGNTGKSFMCKYLHLHHGAIVTGGSAADMKHAITRWQEITGHFPITIIVDVARSDCLKETSMKAIESIKNAMFFSGKYESAMINSWILPHVIIFSNFAPQIDLFSKDRWNIVRIHDDGSYENTKIS